MVLLTSNLKSSLSLAMLNKTSVSLHNTFYQLKQNKLNHRIDTLFRKFNIKLYYDNIKFFYHYIFIYKIAYLYYQS